MRKKNLPRALKIEKDAKMHPFQSFFQVVVFDFLHIVIYEINTKKGKNRMVFLYAFIGVLCLGVAPLFGKTALDSVNPTTAFAIRTVIAAVLVLTWLISTNTYHELAHLSKTFWLFITAEALLAAVFGDLAYFYALQKGKINEVALIMSCTPLITVLLSYLLFDEGISYSLLVGAVLITAGLIVINYNS